MKKLTKITILAVILIIIILFLILMVSEPKIMGAFLGLFQEQTEHSTSTVIDINYGNIESILSKTNLVRDMPKDGKILLKFYNFNKGYREWENSYIIEKDSVKKQEGDADILLWLHSKYLDELNTGNFCSIIQKAKQNGDMGFYSELSKAKLLWRYKSMLKHLKCLGF
jgi:hypothetical protein